MTIKEAKKLTITDMNKIVAGMVNKDKTYYRTKYSKFCKVNIEFIRDPCLQTNDKLVEAINELVISFVALTN